MDQQGSVEALFRAPDAGEPMERVETVEAVAGRGLRGDRYFHERGLYDRQEHLPDAADVTLIEAEVLAAVARDYDVDLAPAQTRRNVLTRGVSLNHLVDGEFHVGDARLVGRRLCEPCGHMASLAGADGAVEALVHRGGLEADVLETGEIRVADPVEW